MQYVRRTQTNMSSVMYLCKCVCVYACVRVCVAVWCVRVCALVCGLCVVCVLHRKIACKELTVFAFRIILFDVVHILVVFYLT